MSKVNRKKLLKEPDEFLTLSERVINWSKLNLQKVLWGATAVALATALAFGAKAYFDYRAQQATAEMAPVMTAYIAAVEGRADKAAMTKLAANLERVTAKYGSTPAGMQARLALGDLRLSLGKYAQAVETLENLTRESDLSRELAPLAWHGLGQALEGAKNYGKAAEAYSEAIAKAGPSLATQYKLDRARVLAAAGDGHAAAQLYRELAVAKSYPEVADQARTALAAMGQEPPAGT